MKLVTYESARQPRLGVVECEYVVDVHAALGMFAKGRGMNSKVSAAVRVLRAAGSPPVDMIGLLGRGEKYRKALGMLTSNLAETFNAKKSRKGLFTPLASARLRAPIARPPKITCVGLNYADH